MMSDASDMLAAALEQMDGIIAGSKALEYSNGLFDCQSPTSPFMGSLRVLHLIEDLRGMLEMMDTDEREGLRCQVPDSTADVLAEWLQGQMVVNGHITGTSDIYQERLSRLENDKESLVLQVSVLTDQVEAQGEKIRDLEFCLEEHREKLNATEEMLQQELLSRTSLETQKLDLMAEISTLKLKLTAVEKDRIDYEERYKDTEGLVQEMNELRLRVVEMENERAQFVKKLKSTKSLMAKLSSMKIKVGQMQYEKQRKEHKCQTLKDELYMLKEELEQKEADIRKLQENVDFPHVTESKGATDRDMEVQKMKKAVESLMAVNEEKSHPKRLLMSEEAFGTRKARSSFGRGFFKLKNIHKKTASTPNLDRSRSASAPTLAEKENGSTDHLDLATSSPRSPDAGSVHSSPSSPDSKKKPRGIKKLFGRLRRSQSTTLNQEDDLAEEEFKRGGTRSTAGPRLGWSRDLGQAHGDLDTPFAKWTKEQVCTWLREQGLGSYVNSCKQWIVSGQTLLHASQHDLEKELGIKHPLHRKKLQLALQSLGSEDDSNYGKLDYKWVTRWLDDIGLPQYKTQFDEAKLDGRMLHYMTVDDLLSLKVVSVLHHLSIKRAIQVLRINSFEANCLRRRPSEESNITPSEVAQWTNHRVMEWLRSVDLAEYAPNLRGSGVHGGLMVLEPRFNVETMAQLLNIPPNKTLLRRHLATHFNLLVGQQAQQQKQEALSSPEYVLLTATAKVKPRKLAFTNFGTLRKKKQEENEEYVCPMELGHSSADSIIKPFRAGLDLRMLDDEDLDRLEQMEDSEGTVRQIGAFSEGINNLTHMLKEDDMFRDYSARSPNASITDEDSNV
ncbi:liprin-beta-1 [Rhinoderma darwinii]|uniref:liprin-beta-1 n=1 Tax=Rhinoderma darwinii TaxID=43563 RepID=UPI003F666712